MIRGPNTLKGSYYKYGTRNPVSRWLVGRFFKAVEELLGQIGFASALDIGCGEGFVTEFISKKNKQADIHACDIEVNGIENHILENSRINFSVQSIYSLGFSNESFDLVVATEVLEHLESPEKALSEIKRLTRRYVILSVPREPLWRTLNMARLAYLKNLGNTPGHLQHWSRRGFKELISSKFDIVTMVTPLPWTIILAEKKLRLDRHLQ